MSIGESFRFRHSVTCNSQNSTIHDLVSCLFVEILSESFMSMYGIKFATPSASVKGNSIFECSGFSLNM